MKVSDLIEHDENELPIEDDTDKWFGGEGRVHLIKNTKKHEAADAKYYYVRVKARGRGFDDLMLTEEEYRNVTHRALRNKEDIPKKQTWKEFFKSLF